MVFMVLSQLLYNGFFGCHSLSATALVYKIVLIIASLAGTNAVGVCLTRLLRYELRVVRL